jgi:phosphate:Na+ symporter
LQKQHVTQEIEESYQRLEHALKETHIYLDQLRSQDPTSKEEQQRHASTLHALDHLERLLEVANRSSELLFVDDPEINEVHHQLLQTLAIVNEWLQSNQVPAPHEELREISKNLAVRRKQQRATILTRTAQGELSPLQAGKQLEAMRRLDEITYYLWRISEHLQGERLQP